MPAFGYVNALAGISEPHAGFKVFVMNSGTVSDDGHVLPADYRIVFHMGTSGVGRYTQQFHSLQYDYVARDGSGREFRVQGLADTGSNAKVGSTCSNPRKGGRDFSTVGCNDPYEIWNDVHFQIKHPNDPFQGYTETRLAATGSFAVFDPVLTRDPADNTRVLYSQNYYQPGSGIDPLSPQARFQGCVRENYGGPNYFRNAGRPTTYYTDAYGNVKPGPGPGLIQQFVSATTSTANESFKMPASFCGNGIRPPN